MNDQSTDYADPVGRLLTIGEPESDEPDQWLDYTARFSIGREHAPDLIRMAGDNTLNQPDSDDPMIWAPSHALRALGQLGMVEAIEPLVTLMRTADPNDDSLDADLPMVFALLGPDALPAIQDLIADPSVSRWPRIIGLSALTEIGLRHVQYRGVCIAHLVALLEPDAPGDDYFKSFVVSRLLDLKAVEAIEAIRLCYQRNLVSSTVAGNLEAVEIELGLRPKRAAAPAPEPPARTPVQVDKIGRNDPCPCGSGKKYKKCCLP